MAHTASRRHFLRSASLAAAAATLPLADTKAHAEAPPPEPFKLIKAGELAEATKGLQAKPGNFSVFNDPALPVNCVLTVEEKKAAKEFEWHEGRDHTLIVLDGSTGYELGGTPQNGRNTRPGEWLAPASEGAATMTLHKGDVLLIPRGTPHKRTTAESVTFYLISSEGVKA